MGAFHIVRVNFQLRLGVRGGVIGEQEILVGLFGVGLLRELPNEDAPMENALRFVIQDAVEIFVAGAVWLHVFDNHVMVGELFVFGEI